MFTAFNFLLIACLASIVHGGREKILLKDIDVLTLYPGQYTTARRSHAVPQVQCVGGTAGCKAFVPQVVQCYNRGSDGYDVQWECKTDMDNAYRFGKTAVTCEGYEYPDDPFVLRGSCGLEYHLDLTKEGYERHGSHNTISGHGLGFFVSIVILIMAVIVIGSIIKMYMSNSHQVSDAPPPYPGTGYTEPPTAPPPPGFHPGYTSSSTPPPPGFYPSYTSSVPPPSGYHPDCSTPFSKRASPGGVGGGFWSGAATGGVLGYLFGSRGQNNSFNQPGYQGYQAPRTNSWWSSNTNDYSGWGSSGTTAYNTGSTGNTASTGTRTASGFGGTRRR